MNKRITAEKFYFDLVEEFNKKKQSCALAAKWRSDTFWTNLMLNKENGIIWKLACKNNLRFFDESWKIDALLCRMDDNIEVLKEGEFTREYDYLCNAEVVVEVENAYKFFLQDEIYKLSLINCPLKVGITYIERADEKFVEKAKERIKEIIEKKYSYCPENTNNEYLIIIIRGPENLDCQKWTRRFTK
jgi:hypothetical protein